jgi:tRNA uridine 5-carbamoylmethylation protein Kti12
MQVPGDGARILLVALCGLPGCGKSTLCRALAVEAERRERALVRVVSFDAFEDAGGDWSPEAWHTGRAAARSAVSSSLLALAAAPNGSLSVLLVDDNAWYRSMRRAHFCAARGANASPSPGCAYATLYLACPLPLALARNAQRPGHCRVPAYVVESMHATLQPPRNGGDWESGHAMTVDATAPLADAVASLYEWLTDTSGAGPRAPRHVPLPVQDEEGEADAARAFTAASALHSAELLLRGHVAREMGAAFGAHRASLALKLACVKTGAGTAVRALARSGVLAALLEGSGEAGHDDPSVALAAIVQDEWRRARAVEGMT